MKKRLMAALMAGVMVLSMAGCGKKAKETEAETSSVVQNETETTTSGQSYRVAMITDYGDVTDQSFNQTSYEACKAFCDANGVDFQYYKPTGDTTAERVASLDQAVAEGFNVVVMPGYAFPETIIQRSEMYPDVKFIALDVSADDILSAAGAAEGTDVKDCYHSDNVFCAVYQEELSGYMAGYAAVKMGYGHLGFLGGMAVPAVQRYGYGFVQGANAAAVELGNADQVTIEYAYGNQFYGDADITAAMDTWYQTNGVEIVFACGGGIYTSAAEAAAKVDGGKVIGVDTDQAPIIDAYGEGMTVTSAMKGLAETVDAVLTGTVIEDNWEAYGGKIDRLGLVSENPEENYVQLPIASTQWNDGFTEDDYRALVAAMYNGEVTVSSDTSAMPEVEITVNDQGNIK